jgi:hypothetical protein
VINYVDLAYYKDFFNLSVKLFSIRFDIILILREIDIERIKVTYFNVGINRIIYKPSFRDEDLKGGVSYYSSL